MVTQEKQLVLKAIDKLGRRVTAADIATNTGLPILRVTTELNTVAAETGGNMQVSTAGDIAYSFGLGYQNAYLATGIKKFLEEIGAGIFKVGYFLLRISFGVMLVLSFLVVVVLLVVVIISMNQGSDRDDGGGRGGGFNFDFLDWMILRDIFWWSTPGYGYGGGYGGYGYGYGNSNYDYINDDRLHEQYNLRTTTRTNPGYGTRKKQNFLLNCFSFLFGDGNPNLHLEERKWQVIAQTIKANKGVVTAEQLAPYTAADPKNEDAALPVLVRFDGRPEVTEKGNIVYVFPSLQVTARSGSSTPLPTYLEEFKWEFTNVPPESLIPVYILAGVNFLGSWWLFFQHSPLILVTLAPLIKVLVAYGTLFLAVPLFRWMTIQYLNARIDTRNQKREVNSNLLRNPGPELRTKLIEAQTYSVGEKRISTSDVVYTTEKDALDQADELSEQFDPKTNKPR